MTTHTLINNPHWCLEYVPTQDIGMIVTEGFVLYGRDAVNRPRALFLAVGSAAELLCCGACTAEEVNYTTNCFEDIWGPAEVDI